MILVIETEYRENYGAHDWDGTGDCPQYWKNKGGASYVVEGVSATATPSEIKKLVDLADETVSVANNYCEESIIDWHIEDDGYRTEDELLQLEYDGKITYPASRLVLSHLV